MGLGLKFCFVVQCSRHTEYSYPHCTHRQYHSSLNYQPRLMNFCTRYQRVTLLFTLYENWMLCHVPWSSKVFAQSKSFVQNYGKNSMTIIEVEHLEKQLFHWRIC